MDLVRLRGGTVLLTYYIRIETARLINGLIIEEGVYVHGMILYTMHTGRDQWAWAEN